MGFVQIDPITCTEVLDLFFSRTISTLLINEIGRNPRRDEKIRLAVGDALEAVLASGVPVYQARYIHGRTFFSEIAPRERHGILSRMIQEVWSGHDENVWLCFDRGELLRAMPPLQQEYSDPPIAEDPYFRVIRNLDNLDYRVLFPESTKTAAREGNKEDEDTRIADLEGQIAALKAELEKARQAEGVNPRSRNTYLKVIAALANRNGKIDLHERGAAVTISRATENFGFPVSEDTTRKIIKEIEELQK